MMLQKSWMPLALSLFMMMLAFTACQKDNLNIDNGNSPNVNNNDGIAFSYLGLVNDRDEGDGEWGEDCFTVNYPVTIVFPDGTTQSVNSDEELKDLYLAWEEANGEDEEFPLPQFPVEVTLKDGTIKTLNNEEDLEALHDYCYDEWDDEDEWDEYKEECFSFNYPLSVVFPDGSIQSGNDDDELKMAFEDWYDNNPDSDDDPGFQYPFDVTLEDGTLQTIQDEEALDDLLESCED